MSVVNPVELPTIAWFGVTLRPWRLADAPALRRACGDAEIMRFTTVPDTYTEQAATEWIRRQREHAERGTAIVLAIITGGEVSPVGMIGLFGLDGETRTARLGYWVVRRARGSGIASAAARALTGWAFDRLRLAQVVVDREPSNRASARIAERLGAIETGARFVEYRGDEVELIRRVVDAPSD